MNNKKRNILIVFFLLLIISLSAIIVFNVFISSKSEINQEEKIKIEDIKAKEDLIKYLEQNNKEEDVTFKVDSEDKEYIKVTKYKKEKKSDIVVFNKNTMEIQENSFLSSGMQGE